MEQGRACGHGQCDCIGEGRNESRFTEALDTLPACSHKAGHIREWPLELNEAAWVPEQVLLLAWSGGT